MPRRRSSGSNAALLLLFFVLMRGFGGRLGPPPRGSRPRRYPPFNAPPGNDNDNLGTTPLPPNPLAMPEAEPGVIMSPGWPQTTPG